MNTICLVLLAILNIGVLWLIWRSLKFEQKSAEITLNGKKYLYYLPEPEKKGEFKGKLATPYIDKTGERHVKYYILQDHIRSLLSTMKKHHGILDELLAIGRIKQVESADGGH